MSRYMSKLMIPVAKIVKVIGLKGEVKFYCYGHPEQIFTGLVVHVAGNEYRIQSTRLQKNQPIVRFENLETRESVEGLIHQEVFVNRDDLPLEEGSYYVTDLIGLSVVDVQTHGQIGILKDVLTDYAQDQYVIDDGQQEIYLPGVDEYIKEINLEKKIIVVFCPQELR